MFTQIKHNYQSFLTSSKGGSELLFSHFESYELFTYSVELQPSSQGIIEQIIAGNPLKFAIEWDEDFFLFSIEGGPLCLNEKAVKLLLDAGIIVPQAFQQSNTHHNAINRY